MPQFGIFEAAVVVDDLELPEYCIKTDHDTKTVTCWIPSEAGKEFKVKCRTIEPVMVYADMRVAGFVKVDGKHGGTTWIGKKGGETVYVSEVVTTATTYRTIMFSSIELTDDDAFLNDERAKDLGDITFSIHLVTCEGVVPTANRELHDSDGKVHERSKKAMVHRVKFGEQQQCLRRNRTKTRRVQTLATFIFKYRSIDILRADGLAPPAPASQKVTGSKRKISDDEVEAVEYNNDENELKALLAKVNKVQKRLDDKRTNSQPNKKVKKESRPVVISNEILDLT